MFLTKLPLSQVKRVAFPLADKACADKSDFTAYSGAACDYPKQELQKFTNAALHTSAPQASAFVEKFLLTDGHMAQLLPMLLDVQRNGTSQQAMFDTACKWLRGHHEDWKGWIPDDDVLLPCPAGEYRPNVPGVTRSLCAPCPAAHFKLERNGDNCSRCPAGFACQQPDLSPVKCASGTFSAGNALTCETVASDKAVAFADGLRVGESSCEIGHTNPELSDICEFCGLGFERITTAAQSQCVSCKKGLYKKVTDTGGVSTSCIKCAEGATTAAVGTTSDSQCVCEPGKEFMSKTIRGKCVCPKGTLLATTGVCELCELNTFGQFENAPSCVPCESGSRTAGRGSTSAVQCICDTGHFNLDLYLDTDSEQSASAKAGGKCRNCLAGLTDSVNITDSSSVVCPGIEGAGRLFTAAGFWRSSNASLGLYPCDVSSWCHGVHNLPPTGSPQSLSETSLPSSQPWKCSSLT